MWKEKWSLKALYVNLSYNYKMHISNRNTSETFFRKNSLNYQINLSKFLSFHFKETYTSFSYLRDKIEGKLQKTGFFVLL
jgi:hypothetical protein